MITVRKKALLIGRQVAARVRRHFVCQEPRGTVCCVAKAKKGCLFLRDK